LTWVKSRFETGGPIGGAAHRSNGGLRITRAEESGASARQPLDAAAAWDHASDGDIAADDKDAFG
jgi:hypothetical protein